MEEFFKVNWLSCIDGKVRTFEFDSYVDDPVNRRYVFQNTETDEVLTINYEEMAHMITAPIRKLI